MLRILKWVGIVILGLICLLVVGCSTMALPRVNSLPDGAKATPGLLVPMGGMEQVTSVDQWEDERAPFWKNILLSQVFGSQPPELPVTVARENMIRTDLFGGKASLKAVTLQFGDTELGLSLDVHFVVPNSKGPHPVVLGAGFCPNHAALPFEGVEPPDTDYPGFCDGSWADPLFRFIFGRYISAPPVEDLIDHGFAFGAYYPGQIVPDSKSLAQAALDSLPRSNMDHGPYGAIGVWAWAASRIEDYIETDIGLDENRVILFGHSRYGKSSLLAGALDTRIAGVISHQSGTGGSSLQKNDIGEPVKDITRNYGHWFSPSYALYAGREQDMPFDQHALVALMAPRPLLLGNSTRDKWSDPKGSFDAARAAGEVWEIYGEPAFRPENLRDFSPEDRLAFTFRGGTHGITPEDWTPFLEWLDVQFGL